MRSWPRMDGAEKVLRDTKRKRYCTEFTGDVFNIVYYQERRIKHLLIVKKGTVRICFSFENLFI